LSADADTSFLTSLYIPDSNSIAAVAEMGHLTLPILVTPLGELEFENALQLRVFRKQIANREHSPHAGLMPTSKLDYCR
jgi:hypothetical protein